jgi:hypothetical protein
MAKPVVRNRSEHFIGQTLLLTSNLHLSSTLVSLHSFQSEIHNILFGGTLAGMLPTLHTASPPHSA